jgi:hypothetical protein
LLVSCFTKTEQWLQAVVADPKLMTDEDIQLKLTGRIGSLIELPAAGVRKKQTNMNKKQTNKHKYKQT